MGHAGLRSPCTAWPSQPSAMLVPGFGLTQHGHCTKHIASRAGWIADAVDMLMGAVPVPLLQAIMVCSATCIGALAGHGPVSW
jgi:hypothetical protein